VQLDRSVSDLAEDEIRSLLGLLAHHGVLCIVRQPPIAPRQLHDFCRRWGEVVELPAGLALANQEPGLPSITRVGNIRPDGSIIPGVRFAEYWHHDGDFWQPGQNFIVNFLSAVRISPVGGRTGFLDSRLGYEMLSDSERADLADAHIWVRASEISDFKKAAPHELPPDARHPVCLPHPITKQIALYLPDSSTGIQKMDGQFLTTVESVIESFQEKVGLYEHAWADGDMLIIDNLQVMHRSMGGYGNHPRLLYRCQARVVT
jgi:taurine dioxygenase